MNEYLERVEKGKAIIRERGMNFTTFKSRLIPLFTVDKKSLLVEDSLVELYNTYASHQAIPNKAMVDSVERWAMWYFQEWTEELHETELKPIVYLASGRRYLHYPVHKVDQLLIVYKHRSEYVVESNLKYLIDKIRLLPESTIGITARTVEKYCDQNSILFFIDEAKTTHL
jgi:hypothetical protein